LQRAEAAARDGAKDADIRSLAYVARQRAGIASEVGARYSAEQQLQMTSVELERVRGVARTREAEQRASAAGQQARAAQQQAEAAQQQADAAQGQVSAQARMLEADRLQRERMQRDLAALSAQPTPRGLVITLKDVLFGTGKAELSSGGVRSVQRVAEVMRAYPEEKVLIEGFTDSQGPDDYNLGLSERRAAAVKQQLMASGVPENRIETRGHGKDNPVADNATEAGRQQNRRVEIVFSNPTGAFVSR
jgi:outer membrane protein OmpA-like peptidoglycan-associated protein